VTQTYLSRQATTAPSPHAQRPPRGRLRSNGVLGSVLSYGNCAHRKLSHPRGAVGKLGSNLGPFAAELGTKPSTSTQNKAERTNEIDYFPRLNGFTCMPGNPKVVADPPMCVDAPALQWFADAKAHKPKPTNTVPGIAYMLAGATQRSDSDPHDTTSMPIEIGPHWMIMWPFDPKATGLPTTHKPTGAYILWAGSPYAHLHVMGRP
jgi:hypothetical protein